MFVSGVQESESVMHIHISSLFRFFSHIGHYRVLSRVPCTIQQVLISYLFYIQSCVYVSRSLPVYPSPSLSFGNHKFVYYIRDSTSVL